MNYLLRVTGVACLAMLACTQTEKNELATIKQASGPPELSEVAKQLAADQLSVPVQDLQIIGSATAHPHYLDGAAISRFKVCVWPCVGQILEINLTTDGSAISGDIDELEASWGLAHHFSIDPELRAAILANPTNKFDVQLELSLSGSIDYSKFDREEFELSILEAERENAFAAVQAELEQHTGELNQLGISSGSIVVEGQHHMKIHAVGSTILTIANLEWVREVMASGAMAYTLEGAHISKENGPNGTYTYQTTQSVLGNGIGLLVEDEGYPYLQGGSSDFMPNFVSLGIGHASPAHTYPVFSLMASQNAEDLGASPGSNFFMMPIPISILGYTTSNFSLTSNLLQSRNPRIDAYNGSWSYVRPPAEVSEQLGITYYDGKSWEYGFSFVFANGNLKTPEGSIDILPESMVSASPANGFNTIAVGGTLVAGNNTTSDDLIHPKVATLNPPSLNADRVKPEVVARATVLVPLPSDFSSWFATTGTSFSAPQVTGLAASIMERVPATRGRPDLLRALLAASATPIAGGLPQGAGWGHVNGTTLSTMMSPTDPSVRQYISRTLPCSQLTAPTGLLVAVIHMAAPGTLNPPSAPASSSVIRLATSWQTQRVAPAPSNTPDADLDIVVNEVVGGVVTQMFANNNRMDSTTEVREFSVRPDADYRVYLRSNRCTGYYPVPVSLAWFAR